MVRPMVRRDRLEAYLTLRQSVFAVGAGTRSIDASFQAWPVVPETHLHLSSSLAWPEGRAPFQGYGVMERRALKSSFRGVASIQKTISSGGCFNRGVASIYKRHTSGGLRLYKGQGNKLFV